ncbi:MAG TPA: glycosyltransferase, partial [Candidatus Binatus sp.]|nr:glycosyltransferase [Candidatus Binatus sp.]
GTYVREYLSFFVRAALQLLRDHRRRRYALVQVATLPDWLVFAALPLRLVGVPVVLDLHEAMPEFFASRFPRLARGPAQLAMLAAERLSVAVATHALTANEALRERLIDRGADPTRVTTVPNAPSLARFDPAGLDRRRFMADGCLRLVYAGAVTPTYDLGVVLDALELLALDRPELVITFDVYGRGDAEDELRARSAATGTHSRIQLHGRLPIERMPESLAAADVGVAPIAPSRFTRLSFSTKLLEYGAMGLPIATARLPLAERLLGDDAVWFFEAGDPASLASAIGAIVDDAGARESRVQVMTARVRALSWELEQARYVALIERLAGRQRAG